MVSTGNESIAIIPGIFFSRDGKNNTAFIMIYDGLTESVFLERFPISHFKCSKDEYILEIGNNKFSKQMIELDIKSKDCQISGSVVSKHLNPWPISIMEHGCMGWYAYVPTMECFHGILSMDHILSGEFNLNGRQLNFDNGRGYLEKDWGKRFPSDWIWAQSNHFTVENVSVTASLANIPWRKKSFAGFIIGLQYNGELYRFTTYNRSTIKSISYDGQHVNWVVVKREFELELSIQNGGSSAVLFAPDDDDMIPKVEESLNGKVSLKLKKHGEIILKSEGLNAGVEIIGNTEKLLALSKE